MVDRVDRLKCATVRAVSSESCVAALWGAVLGATILWVISGTLFLGWVAPLALASGLVVFWTGRVRPSFVWWIGPVLLPVMQVAELGWVDFRSLLPAVMLLVLGCAVGLSCKLPRKWGVFSVVLVYVLVGVGIVSAQVPWTTLLVLFSAPVLMRMARPGETTRVEARQAYEATALLFWVGLLVHGLVR